jgi:exodeoxyribonuclease V alpha subunit
MTTDILTFQVGTIRYSKEGFNIVITTNGDNVSGKFNAIMGHCYQAEGKWETHPTYGPQFKLSSAVSVRIATPEELGRFLTLQLKNKGVGEVVIGTLVASCKEDNLNLEELLDRNQRDTLIECVGKRNEKKVDILLGLWPSIKPKADLVSPLLGYGLSEAMAESAIALWGKGAVQYVEEHPYDLILHIDGVSFLKADSIAMKVGRVGKQDPLRLRAALSTGLQQATSSGDIGVKRSLLLKRTRVLVNESRLEGGKRVLVPGVPLAVPDELLDKTLNDMVAGKPLDEDGKDCGFSSQLVEFPDAKGEMVVWYTPLIEAEKMIAKRLAQFNAPALKPSVLADISMFATRMGVKLAAAQHAAVEMVLTYPASIITGGPGTGKSTTLKTLLAMLDAQGLRGALVAPTGKAAKRITETTGRVAFTVHSLIGWNGGSTCAFDQTTPMTYQYLVVDEASMVDTELMAMLLNAAANSCRIILLGDVDQLPSVGPGQVLRDLINSGVLPVTRLTQGFRFSGGIAEAARAINRGEMPETTDDGQFVFVETETPAQDLLDMVRTLLKDGVNESDIQVLSPTHKGGAGCESLNLAMQAYLNPERTPGASARLKRDSGDIRAGDRVVQKKNDKELKLVNGDIGWLDAIPSDAPISFSLPDRPEPVLMTVNQAQHLRLAYCITVHGSQGSEAPIVLLALDASAAFMLRRNLPYTGVTRASQKAIVFSSRNTFTSAVRRGEPPEGSRRTSLVPKLHEAFAGRPRPVNKAVAEVSDKEAIAASMLLTADLPDVGF